MLIARLLYCVLSTLHCCRNGPRNSCNSSVFLIDAHLAQKSGRPGLDECDRPFPPSQGGQGGRIWHAPSIPACFSIDAHQRKNPSYPANCECVSPLGPSNGDPGGRPPCACFNWRQRCSSARMDERISRFTPVFREEGPERVTCSVYRCPSAPGIRRALRRGDRAFVRIIHFTPADAFRQVQKPRYFPDVAIWKARCGCYRERFSVGSRTDRRKPADYAPPE
jgi:hypothetical protein